MFLTRRFGHRGKDWTLKDQDLRQIDGKIYDVYSVRLTEGTDRKLYFEVTDWLSSAQRT
jgi:hypothetical protein